MVLITGATGILGRVIALELIKRDYRVRACKRSTSDLSDVRRSYRFYTSDPDLYFDCIGWFCTRNYYSGRKVRRRLAFRFHPVRDSLEFHYRNYQACRSQKTADGESKILRRIRRLTGRFSV